MVPSRPVGLLALIWLPFLAIFAFAAPSVTDELGDSHPHVAFHLVSGLLLALAFVTARRLHAGARTRAQRGVLRGLTVTLPLAVLGNLLELGVALARLAEDGWRSRATPEVFEDAAPHLWASNLTIPAHLGSMLLVLGLLVLVAVQRRRLGRLGEDGACDASSPP